MCLVDSFGKGSRKEVLVSEVSLAAAMAEIWLHLGHKISNLFEVDSLNLQSCT